MTIVVVVVVVIVVVMLSDEVEDNLALSIPLCPAPQYNTMSELNTTRS